MSAANSIAAVIIAKNEADRIAVAIKSVQFCNEIIVVDSFSIDSTREIAQSLGAKVIDQEFLGYGAQKNFGFAQSSTEWILSIDADEEVSDGLAKEIQDAISNQKEISAFALRRKNFFLGQELKYGRESKDFLVRLFRNGSGRYEESEVHEVMRVNGEIVPLKQPLFHYTYRSMEHAKQKMQNYAKLGAKELAKRNKRRNPMLIALSYPVYLIKHYLFYGNVLNGVAGWKWSKLMAAYHCQKYKELNKINT